MPEVVNKMRPTADTLSITMDDKDPTKVLYKGFHLSLGLRMALVEFVNNNLDISACSHANMVGIEPNVMCQCLNIDPNKKGVRQKRRVFSGERDEAQKEEVDRLLNVGLVKETFYPNRLANPELVKKPNGK